MRWPRARACDSDSRSRKAAPSPRLRPARSASNGRHADGDWARAAAAYGGPFLEGLRVAGAPEFERWVEEERAHLAQRHAEAVERLAKEALARGEAPEAVRWWRRRASIDPLNARVTVELMRALDASGDRGAALCH